MLGSILTVTTEGIALTEVFLCTAVSLVLGLVVASCFTVKNNYTKNFVVTLAMLPVLVQIVIMLVNGNLGTGVAIVGAFSLIRFRSVAGGAREIASVFWAMGIGLATGMGFIGYAAILTLVVGIVMTALTLSPFGTTRESEKDLKVTIPEDLDYTGIFDDIFDTYTRTASLEKVKTTNMGSLYELHYRIVLKDEGREKRMIDEIRCRNGNLNIVCGKVAMGYEQL